MGTKPEILAPAGSIQGLKAAIAAGCDAIYIGGSRFGARAYADNPNEDEMLEAIAYCHLHGVKLYMTVNTLLKNREMEEALFSFLRPYYEAGVDAVIVQDVGVLHFVSRCFPGLAVHASTQMTLTMGKSLEELRKYHVTRMVPARELTIEELFRMRKDTELELEVFVHGALCYCYSGQCLFSSMLGGRSGNRGRCAQPCRMPYGISGQESKGEDYLLSPKELCNLPFLPELIEAGVDSFKIEGRMKRPEYTAFVTSVYRKYVDLYCSLGKREYRQYLVEHDREWQEDLRQLAELYNRSGFTQGYLAGSAGNIEKRTPGEKGDMLASLRPKHGGVLVGKVLSVGKHDVTYQTTKKLSSQDVVEFRNERQQSSYEYTIGNDIAAGKKVTARYQKGSRIKPGDYVYRTKDAALLQKIQERFLDKEEQLPVQAKFIAGFGKPMCLQVTESNVWRSEEIQVECIGEFCQRAERQPATEEAVRKTLNQTGNSPFYFSKLEIILDGELFLPVGAVKKLRRQALEELKQKMVSAHYRNDTILPDREEQNIRNEDGQVIERPFFTASVMRLEQLNEVLKRPEIQVVYLHTEIMNEKELKNAYFSIQKADKSPWLVLPVIFRAPIWNRFEREWKKADGLFSLEWEGYLVKNMESLQFLTGIAGISREKLRLDYNMYVMNQEACDFWQEQGISRFTLPLEITEKEMEQLSYLAQSELLVYGKVPLMVSAQCIQSNTQGCVADQSASHNKVIYLKDQKKRVFEAVNYCKYCYNIIYQKEPLYIREAVLSNPKLCVSGMRYSFTTESGPETAEILEGTFEKKTQFGHFRLGIQ